MATNVIQNLTDELSKLEAKRAEMKGQLRTMELCQPTPDAFDDQTSSAQSSPVKEAEVLAGVLQASYEDLKKRHFHLQNDHAALLSSIQDLKLQNGILTKKCDYLSSELTRLAKVDLSTELIRLASFAGDNGPASSSAGNVGESSGMEPLDVLFDHTALAAEHSNDAGKAAGKSSDREVLASPDVEVPATVVQKRGRGRPRKFPPKCSTSRDTVQAGASKRRGRKPGFKLSRSEPTDLESATDEEDSNATLAQASGVGRGKTTNAKRKQQFDESKKEGEGRKRASIEARNKRMAKKPAKKKLPYFSTSVEQLNEAEKLGRALSKLGG